MIFEGCSIAILCNSPGILQVSHIFFSRLDYFLVSNSLVNTVCDYAIIPGFKSYHSVVTIRMLLTSEKRGPGYFKINESLLSQNEYQIQLVKQLSTM